MPRRVLLSRRVQNWVEVEAEYLAARSRSAALRFRERIASAQRLIADHPRIGRRGTTAGTRRLVVIPYLMTYREIGRDIVIVDIRHGRQTERSTPESTQSDPNHLALPGPGIRGKTRAVPSPP